MKYESKAVLSIRVMQGYQGLSGAIGILSEIIRRYHKNEYKYP